MKKFWAVLLAVFMIFSFAACGEKTEDHEISEYILDLEYKDDFKVLTLCDTHLANKDNRKLHYDYLDVVIKGAKADMIVVLGDMFTFADKTVAKEFFNFLDGYGVPWTVTFGNHDEQCYFSIDWVTAYLNNFGSNCMFKDVKNDNIYGYANHAINLNKGGKTVAQLVVLDSNRYNYGEYWGYDYLKPEQIEWYENVVNYTTKKNGSVVPSIMMMHIPFPEYQTAWDEAVKGNKDAVLEYGEMNEPSSCPQINTGMFDSILKLGSTKSVICAHDHVDNSRVKYKGVDLCYGLTSTDRIYYKDGMMGGLVVTIHNDGSLAYDYQYHTYEEAAK